jgi:hypothetical protein
MNLRIVFDAVLYKPIKIELNVDKSCSLNIPWNSITVEKFHRSDSIESFLFSLLAPCSSKNKHLTFSFPLFCREFSGQNETDGIEFRSSALGKLLNTRFDAISFLCCLTPLNLDFFLNFTRAFCYTFQLF